MAVSLEAIRRMGFLILKMVLRFVFMVVNNMVAIPSYVFYLIALQPLRLLDRKLFWSIEGVMFKWLLAMVASWGWTAGYTVIEWGDDVHTITEDEAVMLVNHQATGDVCTLMMCLQDKGMVVRQMMWLMDHIFKYTNFGVVSLVHGDFFIRQGKAYRDQQLILLKVHLEKYYRSRDRKWIILFPEGGFLRKRRETSQLYAKKNNLPFITHVTLPRLGATQVILNTLLAQQENGTPAGGDMHHVGMSESTSDETSEVDLHNTLFEYCTEQELRTVLECIGSYEPKSLLREVLRDFRIIMSEKTDLSPLTCIGGHAGSVLLRIPGRKANYNMLQFALSDRKPKGLQWVIDTTIGYPDANPMDIQTWILGYRPPTVTHVYYRIYPIKEVPMETEALTDWLYQRFVEKEELLSHFYKTGAFPPLPGQKKAVPREMTLNNIWLFLVQSLAFLSGYMWYCVLHYFYQCLF